MFALPVIIVTSNIRMSPSPNPASFKAYGTPVIINVNIYKICQKGNIILYYVII